MLADEQATTAAAFWRRAVIWFASRGVTVERVLTDIGSCYRSRLWTAACDDFDVTHKRTRPYRPQINGKVERFHRTLAVEWAYVRAYSSEAARVAPCASGCTSTTITAPTPRWAAKRPQAASPTCRGSTPRPAPAGSCGARFTHRIEDSTTCPDLPRAPAPHFRYQIPMEPTHDLRP